MGDVVIVLGWGVHVGLGLGTWQGHVEVVVAYLMGGQQRNKNKYAMNY